MCACNSVLCLLTEYEEQRAGQRRAVLASRDRMAMPGQYQIAEMSPKAPDQRERAGHVGD